MLMVIGLLLIILFLLHLKVLSLRSLLYQERIDTISCPECHDKDEGIMKTQFSNRDHRVS